MFNQSYGVHIMPLIINSLGDGYTYIRMHAHAHTHTYTHTYTHTHTHTHKHTHTGIQTSARKQLFLRNKATVKVKQYLY